MVQAVLFDLDGTLADTAADLGGALNRMLLEEGLPPQPYAAIRPLASHGVRGLLGLGYGITPEHPDFERLRERFLAHYETHLCDETRLFDGIAPLIEALAQRGLPWGIVTNKPMRFTDPLVLRLTWPTAPGVVVSADTVGVAKPDPRPMRYAAETLGVAPERCWYVGDAERDIAAGRAVGMKTVLANWGYIASTDLPLSWGADVGIDHPLDLLLHLPK
ncbi:phosphoglycolate phosphatase [Chitiniphilus shinanonensis]|uniref:Phosphoglycolate phosphatase n=1 Tax=Chitiniphilus shinanonensis TaxID=553088 RepID=A0ABQ6BTM6_9NEIS|nr:HAD-IA family hydrolase [Chitiniphilus shinanonensis]GLS05008.1 phosphoglycolate phosphatase [Chitiniphilus shinanonensis]